MYRNEDNQTITIEPMREDDALGKAFVHYRSWHDTYASIIPKEAMDTVTLAYCEMIAIRYPQNTLVLKDKGEVVGFSGYFAHENETQDFEVMALYILKDYQGLGLGKLLLEETLTFNTMHPVILWVFENNHRAIDFYKSQGFEKTLESMEVSLSGVYAGKGIKLIKK